MKVRDLLRQMQKDGWYLARQRGSHRQMKHPDKPQTVTVPGHLTRVCQTWQVQQQILRFAKDDKGGVGGTRGAGVAADSCDLEYD